MVTKLKGMFSSKGTIWIHNYNGISIKIKQKQLMRFLFEWSNDEPYQDKNEKILT